MKNSFHVDYVIVGAGSAGCVLANRLTETGSDTVAILEAGPMDRNLMIHIPAGVYSVYRDPKINWNYVTEAEPELRYSALCNKLKIVGSVGLEPVTNRL